MKNKTSSKYFVLFATLFLPVFAFAESTAAPAAAADSSVVSYTFLAIGAAVAFGGLWAIANLYNAVIFAEKARLIREYSPQALEKAGIKIETESLWKRLYKKATNVVPVEKEKDIMLDHDYDGIHELDNSLPPWWLAIFYITAAIAPIYLWYNHFSDYGKSQAELYEIEIEEAKEEVKAYLATQADLVDENTVTALTAQSDIDLGKTMYDMNCAACHKADGGGSVGPNLTDEYWLHGGGIKNVFTTIKYGVPEKGMIAWKAQLRPADMQRIASYILTMQGSNPEGGKEPQGNLWVPETADKGSEEATDTSVN